MDRTMLWYANRGSGVVLIAMFTLSTALGIVATVRAGSARWPRFATQALHRNVSLISVGLLLIHVTVAVLDSFVDLTWLDILVPLQGNYAAKHRVGLFLGSAAFDLLAVVVLTSLFRHRMGHRFWRTIHLLSYVCWGAGLWHGIVLGTDTSTIWDLAVTWISVALVAGAVLVRIATWAHERRLAADALPLTTPDATGSVL
jgi:methionine sulfoxide reductase heme-binding subunit